MLRDVSGEAALNNFILRSEISRSRGKVFSVDQPVSGWSDGLHST